MDKADQICHADQFQKRQQHGYAIGRDDRSDQSEYANRREFDNNSHDLDRYLGETFDDRACQFSLLSCYNYAKSEEQGDHDNLEHGCVRQRLYRIGWKYVDDGIDKRWTFYRLKPFQHPGV